MVAGYTVAVVDHCKCIAIIVRGTCELKVGVWDLRL
jgi:hypothetical protein